MSVGGDIKSPPPATTCAGPSGTSPAFFAGMTTVRAAAASPFMPVLDAGTKTGQLRPYVKDDSADASLLRGMLQSAGVRTEGRSLADAVREFQTQHNEGSGTKIGVDGKAGAETLGALKGHLAAKADKDLKLDDKERDRFRAFMGTRGPETPASREVPRDAVSGAQVGSALRAGEASARHVLECKIERPAAAAPVAAAAGAPEAAKPAAAAAGAAEDGKAAAKPDARALEAELAANRRAQSLRGPHISLGADGQVVARGGAGNERFQLARDGNDVRVRISDRDSGKILANERFDASKVKGVTVDAGDGDDVIENGFRSLRGVDGAVIQPGAGTNLVYNNGVGAHIQGSQAKPQGAAGDIVLNEGARTRIDGSSGADHIVSNARGSRITATGAGDLTVATGADQEIDAGRTGRVVSNGQNNLRAVRDNVLSSPGAAIDLETGAQLEANRLRGILERTRLRAGE